MASHTSQAVTNQLPPPLMSVGLGQMALGVVARYNWHMHMTKADGIRGCGSDDKRYMWHLHMTKADGSRGSGSDDKRDEWHMY